MLIWMLAICIHDQSHNKRVTSVIAVHASGTYKTLCSRDTMMMLDEFVECFQKEDIHMADLPNRNDATRPPSGLDNDNNIGLDRGVPPSTPRWVYVFGIIALVVIVLFVILHLTGGGFRGHGGHTPPSSVVEQSVQQP
jgi:hypothetical protein